MQSLVTKSVEEYKRFCYKDYNDRKVLLLQDIKDNCQRCGTKPCDGRMSVRRNISTQYSMGVCQDCFHKE